MKKLILTAAFIAVTAIAGIAAEEKFLAEVIGVEYNSTILETEKNSSFKENDKVVIEPAGNTEGMVTAVEGNIVVLAVKNNGFAAESKILVKKADTMGNAGVKKAEVKAIRLNSIILDVKNNTFQVQDKVSLAADGAKEAKVSDVNGNIVILSLKDSGFAEGSKITVSKQEGGFKERFTEKKRKK